MADTLGSISLLYVGRDSAIANDLKAALERENERFIVETATDIESALDRFAEGCFECLIAEDALSTGDTAAFLSSSIGWNCSSTIC